MRKKGKLENETVTNCHVRAFFLMRKLQHLPKYGPLVPRESFKMPRKENVFPRIHPELGIHWYYTHLSLTNTPIYHHLRMPTNSRFNWTTFSHSRLNIATYFSVSSMTQDDGVTLQQGQDLRHWRLGHRGLQKQGDASWGPRQSSGCEK